MNYPKSYLVQQGEVNKQVGKFLQLVKLLQKTIATKQRYKQVKGMRIYALEYVDEKLVNIFFESQFPEIKKGVFVRFHLDRIENSVRVMWQYIDHYTVNRQMIKCYDASFFKQGHTIVRPQEYSKFYTRIKSGYAN